MSRIVVPGKDPVTFENCDLTVYKQIGSLIHTAAEDPAAFQDLQNNTAARLIGAGVPPASIQNMAFDVVKDEDKMLNIIVPEVKARDQFGTQAEFDAYLVHIATVTLRACKRATPKA